MQLTFGDIDIGQEFEQPETNEHMAKFVKLPHNKAKSLETMQVFHFENHWVIWLFENANYQE